ncbi:unnamed protein product, partial [Mesorhabditis belari]|uniref:Dihydrolipoamide acetyltransferase component of pyruvate dehydrogenase complex n=1 Tax=Mesorhabditis belari TaxID=2138241 RepID=A0AAF3FH45_9BILA
MRRIPGPSISLISNAILPRIRPCLSQIAINRELSGNAALPHRTRTLHQKLEGKQMRNFSSASLPTHIKVPLPALSPTMELGTIVAWHKKEGDQVAEGDLLCDIETDKATMGFETPEEGYLAKILFEAGTRDIPIGKLVCIIVSNKDDVAAFASFKDEQTTPKTTTPPKTEAKPAETKEPAASQETKHGAHNSELMGPAVRLLFHHYGLKAEDIKRSGPKQNVLKEDALAYIASKKLQPIKRETKPVQQAKDTTKYEDIPLTNIRSIIAKRLLQSKQTIPHEYLSIDIRSDKLNALRRDLKNKKIAVSINDFLVKGCALGLRAVPEVNVQWSNQTSVLMQTVDISIAVATETGLITPIVFGADRLGIMGISEKTKELAKKAKANKLAPNEFQGGTFTISNLGMFGSVTNFTAIINPPQSAILAVGGPRSELDEELNTFSRFAVTLCYDSRAISADSAKRFLAHLSQSLSDPELMLVEPLLESQFDFSKLL